MTCALAYGYRFSITMLAGLVPRSSRSRGSPSSARQKMQPVSRVSAPMYAMRHGAHRTSIPRPAPALVEHLGVVGGPRLAVDAQPELLPDLEERDALRMHRHQRAGLRVAALARLSMLHHEAAEAPDLDALTAHQRLGEALE